jgi:AraC family ethanolamine operon transcriptional activator
MNTMNTVEDRSSISSPTVTTLNIFNPDVLGRALPFGAPDFTLLAPGSFAASFAQTRLGDGWLSVGDTTPPIITRMMCPEEFCLLGFLLDAKGEGRINGQPASPGTCMFAPAGARIYYRTAFNTKWAALYVPRDKAACTHSPPDTLKPRGSHGDLELFRPGRPEGRRLFHRVGRLWTRTLAGIATTNGAAEMTQLENDFFAAWTSAKYDESPSMSQARFNRYELLMKADEFLRANVKRPVSMSELTKATEAGEGALRYAFMDILALTPKSYSDILRLNGIHRDLMEATPEETTEESMRRAWSYGESSLFSRSYEELFGETPAETLHRWRRVCPTHVPQ